MTHQEIQLQAERRYSRTQDEHWEIKQDAFIAGALWNDENQDALQEMEAEIRELKDKISDIEYDHEDEMDKLQSIIKDQEKEIEELQKELQEWKDKMPG